ncbi:MAG: DUF5690 family protein [Bacteroidota bacterium]|nr:DUF5690 family protein [Bacteroidota bacterium]
MSFLTNQLKTSKTFFIAWCMIAAFGTYFSMYAFRKPFNNGTYSGYYLWGLDYKVILIIFKVLGYMLSKFIGIKIISELKPSQRIKLVISLIVFSLISLFLFGLVPYPYNFICMFFSSLPLGMVWGIVFSFLEGRRLTEMLSFGLCFSLIVASGILKTIYFEVQSVFPMSEFWMPFVIGLIFLPVFCFFVWMLSVIPAPTEEDKLVRTERVPMTRKDKMKVIREYGFGLVCIVLTYAMLTMLRDFRDNFSVEIWTEIDKGFSDSVFSQTELIIGVVVLAIISSISLIRNNVKGFRVTFLTMIIGALITGLSTLLFHLHILTPFYWMLFIGMGMFLAYTPVQVVLFERMFGVFKTKGNAGFFMYMCDSIGYLGSVGLLLYKEFYMKNISWANVMIKFSYLLTGISVLLLIMSLLFFNRKLRIKNTATKNLEKFQLLNQLT